MLTYREIAKEGPLMALGETRSGLVAALSVRSAGFSCHCPLWVVTPGAERKQRQGEDTLREGKGTSSAQHGSGWKDELIGLIATQGKFGAKRLKPISNRTQDMRQEVLFLAFRTLPKLGFRVKRISDFGERHVQALMKHWEAEGLAASTLQLRLSILRTLAGWLGKRGMVKGIDSYLEDPSRGRRQTTAQHDHSWSAVGIDAAKMISDVTAFDHRVGMQLKLMHAFALRREEAVMFRPHKADQGSYIVVRDGTKGGRERTVPIDLPYQRAVLDEAKTMAKGMRGHVGHPDHNLEQALRRFNYVVGERFGLTRKQLGVTSHGLRHQGLNDMYERLAGIPSPVRGQTKDMFVQADPMKIEYARQRVAEVAGHARLSISGAYLGGRLSSHERPKLTAEESFAWTRLYELKRLGAGRTEEQTQELEELVDRLLSKVAGVQA